MSVYDPLGRWLARQPPSTNEISMAFTDIERVLGRSLPASARRHRPWWSNEREGSHVQARAWMNAGWIVAGVDLAGEHVVLRRAQSAPSVKPSFPSRLATEENRATVALVSCVKSKRGTPTPARDLYTSTLFRGSRAYAERNADRWFILSAKHGLLDPNDVIAPYELTLKTMRVHDRHAWARRVLTALDEHLGVRERIMMLAGEDYLENLLGPLQARGHEVILPLQGLNFGKRLAWLAART